MNSFPKTPDLLRKVIPWEIADGEFNKTNPSFIKSLTKKMKTAILFSAANAQLISFGKSCYKPPLIADFDLDRVRRVLLK